MSRARRRRSGWAVALGAALLVGGALGVYVQRVPATGLTVSEVAFSSRLTQYPSREGQGAVSEQAGTRALRRALFRSPHVHLAGAGRGPSHGWRLLGVVQPDPAAPGALQLGLKASPLAADDAPLVAFVALAEASQAGLDAAAQRGVRLLAAMRAVRDAGPPAWRRLLAEDALDAAEGAEQAMAALGAAPAGEAEGEPDDTARGSFLPIPPRQGEPLVSPPPVSARDALSSWAQLQAVALERLIASRLPQAGESLLPLVERAMRDDATAYAQQLGLQAVGGLVTLQDQKAVLPLIDMAQRREPALVLQLVYAIAALGGRHAEGYLVTLASGHPHPEVRQAARQAVAEMLERARREELAAPATDPA